MWQNIQTHTNRKWRRRLDAAKAAFAMRFDGAKLQEKKTVRYKVPVPHAVQQRSQLALVVALGAGDGLLNPAVNRQAVVFANHLAAWVRRCGTAEELAAIVYGADLPADLAANMAGILSAAGAGGGEA